MRLKTFEQFLLRRAIALATALSLLAGAVIPVQALVEETNAEATESAEAAEENSTVVTISTAEEFTAFAKNCRYDRWSVGLTVILENDINLLGAGFEGIASFSGKFIGNHHTISNLNLTHGDGSVGMIRYLESCGTVENLNVRGIVKSSRSTDVLGGIVGINAGTVTGCSFAGAVKASGTAGGIVGINGASGVVTLCTNTGSITSQNMVGGIAGQNFGAIADCSNSGNVNSDSTWVDSSPDEGSLTEGTFASLTNGQNIGGIAGWNSGLLASCLSSGIVGYKRSGQNVGGIVGFTEGDVIGCSHSGKVYGKQNVGGIAGHVEPFVQLEDSESIRSEVDVLHDMIDTAVNDMSALTDDIHTDMGDLTNHAELVSDTAKAISDELVDVVNKNIDVVNDLSDRVDYVNRHMPAVFNQVDKALESLKKVNNDLKKVKDDLNIEDKLESSTYDPAAHDRVALLSSVGGTLSVDNRDPAEGASVTVTAKPQEGYYLESMSLQPYRGTETAVTPSGNTYTFTMPQENVTIRAAFAYLGQYVASSTAGGTVTWEENETQLSIRAAAADGYSLAGITLGGVDITALLLPDGNGSTATVNKSDYPAPSAGQDVTIYGQFAKRNGAHRVEVQSSTGGSAFADPAEADDGELVTVTVSTTENYRVDAILVNGDPSLTAQTGENDYAFTMPDADAKVEVLCKYIPDSETVIYAESTVGGTVRVVQIPLSNDYRVMVYPADGYAVADPALYIYSSGASVPDKTVNANDLENGSYTININNYAAPILVKAAFTRETTAQAIPVTAVGSTGGAVIADRSTAKAGETMVIATENMPHYRLQKLTANGQDITSTVSGSRCEYIVPDVDKIHVEAQFSPVPMAMTSTGGSGNASYRVDGNEVILTVEPGTGYALDTITVTAGGTALPIQKQYESSEVYRFTADFPGSALCSITFTTTNDKATVEDAKDRIESNVDEVADATDRASEIIEDVEELLTDDFGNPKDPGSLTKSEAEQLEKYLLELLDVLGDAASASGQIAKDAGTLGQVLGPYIEDALEALNDDLDATYTHVDEMTTALQNAVNETRGIVNYLNSLEKLKAVKFSENFSRNSDKLSGEIRTMLDIMRRLNDNLNVRSDRLEQDMRKINDQLDKVLGMILERLENLESMADGEDLWVDCSTDDTEGNKITRLLDCTNRGLVDGSTAVGGIAGEVQAEIRNIAKDGVSVGKKYQAAALVENCSGQGIVTVKKEDGGGIVGRLSLGLVKGCRAGGGIFGRDADYLGGVAGRSNGTLQGCSSLSQLEGNQYIGGIAGAADKIRDCLSMATIPVYSGRIGAIAGVDKPEDETDETLYRLTLRERISGNRYVSSGLSGIDGISYIDSAEPVSYEQMMAREDAPAEFRHLQVIFADEENQVVGRVSLPYGASLENLEYPQLSAEDSGYMAWDKPVSGVMESSMVLRAGITANVTILPSEQKFRGKALALAEGVFTEEARLQAAEADLPVPANLPQKAETYIHTLKLENTGLTDTAVTRIRLLQQTEGTSAVLVMRGGDWEELPTEQIGQYLQVEMRGCEESFCIVIVPGKDRRLIYGIGALALGVAIACGAVLIRRKKHAAAENGEADEN